MKVRSLRQTSAAIILTTLAVLLFSAVAAQAKTFTTLYNFTGGRDGGRPYAAVIQDPSGNLYSTAFEGGDLSCAGEGGAGCGVVFELNSAGTETVLHNFTGFPSDGVKPQPLWNHREGRLQQLQWPRLRHRFQDRHGGQRDGAL
jgi:hypothetical protein